MYLGSAAAMWILPSISAVFGAASLLTVDGALGFSWLAGWLMVGREIPHRWATKRKEERLYSLAGGSGACLRGDLQPL